MPPRLLALTLVVSACSPNAFSPPARTLPLESSGTLGTGASALQLEGGSSAEVFGPRVVHGGIRVRHGVSERLDLSAEANATAVLGANAGVHPGVYAARGGLKFAPTPHFALTAGIGAGASAVGGFLSPDFGFIAGYENPWVVPFFSVRAWLSQPLAAREVEMPSNNGGSVFDTPTLTWGIAASTGVRVPFRFEGEPAGSFLTGVGFTTYSEPRDRLDDDNAGMFFGLSLGLELLL